MPGFHLVFRCRPGRILTVGLALAVASLPAAAVGEGSLPDSHIDRPADPGPIFVMGFYSLGSTAQYTPLEKGYGALLLFRPLAAADFLNSLYRQNTAMLWQGGYRIVGDQRSLLTLDFILRRYLADMRGLGASASTFIGLGLGMAKAEFPTSSGGQGDAKWWTLLGELGYEFNTSGMWIFSAKGQWRIFSHEELDYSGWTVQFAAGLPVPW